MKMMRDMVCVDPEKTPRVSEIIDLPEDTKARAKCYGLVKHVGPKCTFVKPGDFVWFEDYEHQVGPLETILIAESEILARRWRDN